MPLEHDRVLAIIQAGGTGGRMEVLSRERAKPALPFAGVYQLIDFPLSNLSHSGISDVWLSVQYLGSTLEEQVANGRPWDLDRTYGGLRLLMPQEGAGTMDEEGFARGNADELFRFRDQMSDFDPEVVLVMSADHVYRLDYQDVLDTHRERGAEATVVVVESPEGDDPGDHGVVELAEVDEHVEERRLVAVGAREEWDARSVAALDRDERRVGQHRSVDDRLERQRADPVGQHTARRGCGEHLLHRRREQPVDVARLHIQRVDDARSHCRGTFARRPP